MKTILLVEDNEIIRESAAEILREIGFNVITAENGKEGYKIWQNNRDTIDLVITDCNMPVWDGNRMVAEMRAVNITAKIIMVTGNPNQAVGVDYAIAKPARYDQLATTYLQQSDSALELLAA